MLTDETYMRRCFQLAAKGLGRVRPNPLVGCVIVKDNIVLAEGYHQRHGGFHAERNAILAANANVLKGATLYVNLEPCSHYGLTPPCADLVVESGIKRVVCCNDDPNPLVAGRGFERLENAGIEIQRHVLEDEGRHLNRRFFTFMEQQRPYVILKWAQSADGYMAPEGKEAYWLSSPQQTFLSHQWRTQEAAIAVGSQTYIDDKPRLTARLCHGNQPLPIVIDRRQRLTDVPQHWHNSQANTPHELLHELYDRKIQSLIVEGGRHLLDAFIEAHLYDEVRIMQCRQHLGGGLLAPAIPQGNVHIYC